MHILTAQLCVWIALALTVVSLVDYIAKNHKVLTEGSNVKMVVELISVGTELLLGNIVNTNTQFLAEKCALLGLSMYHQVTVGRRQRRRG